MSNQGFSGYRTGFPWIPAPCNDTGQKVDRSGVIAEGAVGSSSFQSYSSTPIPRAKIDEWYYRVKKWTLTDASLAYNLDGTPSIGTAVNRKMSGVSWVADGDCPVENYNSGTFSIAALTDESQLLHGSLQPLSFAEFILNAATWNLHGEAPGTSSHISHEGFSDPFGEFNNYQGGIFSETVHAAVVGNESHPFLGPSSFEQYGSSNIVIGHFLCRLDIQGLCRAAARDTVSPNDFFFPGVNGVRDIFVSSSDHIVSLYGDTYFQAAMTLQSFCYASIILSLSPFVPSPNVSPVDGKTYTYASMGTVGNLTIAGVAIPIYGLAVHADGWTVSATCSFNVTIDPVEWWSRDGTIDTATGALL